MEKISWKDEFSSGVQYVDQQHELLVSNLNRLIDAYQAPDDAGDAEWLFLDFLKKCQRHFQEEESILTQRGYTHLDSFNRYHRKFSEKVEDLHRLSLLSGRSIPVSVILFLRQWVVDHLDGAEMKHVHALMVAN